MMTEEYDVRMGPAFVFSEGCVRVQVDLRVYRLIAIQKTAYRCAERCTAVIGTPDKDQLLITFSFRPETVEKDACESVRLFFQELLDQELREQIGGETRAIRALILAQAFSKTDLIRRD